MHATPDDLPLPEGVKWAQFIADMREVVQYVISMDAFVARWDTIAGGRQYCCTKVKPPLLKMSLADWLQGERINSKRHLLELISDGVETKTEIVR